MKKAERGCQPQKKVDAMQLIMNALFQRHDLIKQSSEYVRVEIEIKGKWYVREEAIIYHFVENMNCDIKQMNTKRRTYIISGNKEIVSVVEKTLMELPHLLEQELELEWKHYKSLDESAQIAYADLIGAPKEYITSSYIYDMIRKIKSIMNDKLRIDASKLS